MNLAETKPFRAVALDSIPCQFSPGAARIETLPLSSDGEESDCVRKIARSIDYMARHLDQPLQVAGLAAQASISPSHYFALFKRYTGSAPIDYFIRLRMRQACRLLAATTMNVKEVAAALGYDDPFYFSRLFKSVNQVAPSEYRALNAGGKRGLESSGAAAEMFSSPVLPWVESDARTPKVFHKQS